MASMAPPGRVSPPPTRQPVVRMKIPPETTSTRRGNSLATVKKLLTWAPARTPRTFTTRSTPMIAVSRAMRGAPELVCGTNSPR